MGESKPKVTQQQTHKAIEYSHAIIEWVKKRLKEEHDHILSE